MADRKPVNQRNVLIDFLIVFFVAALVRFVFINKFPPALYWEEVALGYDAYSILRTGKDFHGNSFPVVAFESFGDYKPSGYFYATVPSIFLFGLTPLGVRFPAALFGSLTAGILYLLLHEVGNRKIALLSGLTLALLPWHIHFSRAGFEVVLATFLLVLGILFMAKARHRHIWLVGASLACVAAMYTYHGLRLLAPLIGLMLAFFWGKEWLKSKWFYGAGAVALFLLFPLLQSFSNPTIQQRFNETNLFVVSEAVGVTNEERATDKNAFWAKLTHHRYWFWGSEVIARVFNHFDGTFLFLSGDENPRHQTGFFGLLYHWQIVPLVLGIVLMTTEFKRFGWLLLWVVLASLPPALTVARNHSLRFLPAAPAFAGIIGVGLSRLFTLLTLYRLRMAAIGLALGVISVELLAYGYDYLKLYPVRSSQDWQYGYEELFGYIKDNYHKYEHIYITRSVGRPSMYAFFYLQIDPSLVQEAEAQAPKDQGEMLSYDRLLFEEGPHKPHSLVVTGSPREGQNPLQVIHRLDGTGVFYVYET